MSGELGARGRDFVRRHGGRLATEVEVYEKEGRSRTIELGPLGERFQQSREAGWAVRAGDAERSWFRCGSGGLPAELDAPEATHHALALPSARGSAGAAAAPGEEAPLTTESEGRALLAGVARELGRELPGAEVVAARLDDGASEASLVSTRGVTARTRHRAAALRLEARAGGARVEAEWVARDVAELKPLAVARRVADRLLALGERARPPQAGTILLSAPVAARLLEALAPWLVGRGARERLGLQLGAGDELGSPQVGVVDDGGFAGAPLAAAVDGEGVPSRAVRLVERGRFVTPLVAWWEADDAAAASGCSLRPSWRDLPRRGPTQLYVEPSPGVAVPELVAAADATAYLIGAEGGVRVDEGLRFSLRVSGFALAAGRAAGGLGPCRLHGSLAAWLRGVRALARDLVFVPGAGLYGAPSMLVEGLELEPAG